MRMKIKKDRSKKMENYSGSFAVFAIIKNFKQSFVLKIYNSLHTLQVMTHKKWIMKTNIQKIEIKINESRNLETKKQKKDSFNNLASF